MSIPQPTVVDLARMLGIDALVLSDANLQLCYNLLGQGVDPEQLALKIQMILKESQQN